MPKGKRYWQMFFPFASKSEFSATAGAPLMVAEKFDSKTKGSMSRAPNNEPGVANLNFAFFCGIGVKVTLPLHFRAVSPASCRKKVGATVSDTVFFVALTVFTWP